MKPLRDTAKRLKLRLPMVAAALVWIALAPSPYGAGDAQEPARPKSVLALHLGGVDNQVNATFDKSIRAALASAPAGSIEYYAEYLDRDRFAEERLRDYLRQKYGDHRLDLITALANPPLNFLLKYRSDLFPRTPIVFHAGSRADLIKRDEANGVPVAVDRPYRNTVDLALKLHPGTKQVLLIAGMPGHDKRLETEVREELKEFEDREVDKVEINSLSDLSLDELITRVKSAPEHSFILYVRYSQEELGKALDPINSLTLIAQTAKVPVYTAFESILGRGSVGGRTAPLADCGRMAGETAMRIVNGARPQDIPPVIVPTVPIFDWRQLRRWGISNDWLPKESVFLFKEPTFWEEYKWWITGSISLCGIQTLLIVALSLQRARRKRIEVALAEKELRLREAQTIARLGSFHWDVGSDA